MYDVCYLAWMDHHIYCSIWKYWIYCIHDWDNLWMANTDQKLLSLSNMGQMSFWPLRALRKMCVFAPQSRRRSWAFFAFVVKSLLYMAVCSTFSNQWCPFCSFLDVSWAALISNKLCSLTLHRRYDYGRTLVVHQMSVTQMVLLLNQQIWSIVKMTPLLQDDVFRRVSSLDFFIKTIQ